jgi:hypothetical protein
MTKPAFPNFREASRIEGVPDGLMVPEMLMAEEASLLLAVGFLGPGQGVACHHSRSDPLGSGDLYRLLKPTAFITTP